MFLTMLAKKNVLFILTVFVYQAAFSQKLMLAKIEDQLTPAEAASLTGFVGQKIDAS